MDAFFGEIRAFPYNFVPMGWMECAGQTLNIQANPALYSILGIRFGGDGQTNFKLPDLRGLAATSFGPDALANPWPFGQSQGAPTVTLNQTQIPSHDHVIQTQGGTPRLTAPGNTAMPAAPQFISGGTTYVYPAYASATASPAPVVAPMSPMSISVAGGGQPHDNHSPYLVFHWCINVDSPDSVYPVKD
ncbi:phage tail protein [Azospirillum soli]|uniref:phage tail protein n=1 Tax=Azospirillum soli TaxID=1304799 RepID=UPI001AE52E33|nr:tail fiber protein [Azospirillum soli]MBP2312713.1 microcystin-dependent protein [Azospirillum soli]